MKTTQRIAASQTVSRRKLSAMEFFMLRTKYYKKDGKPLGGQTVQFHS